MNLFSSQNVINGVSSSMCQSKQRFDLIAAQASYVMQLCMNSGVSWPRINLNLVTVLWPHNNEGLFLRADGGWCSNCGWKPEQQALNWYVLISNIWKNNTAPSQEDLPMHRPTCPQWTLNFEDHRHSEGGKCFSKWLDVWGTPEPFLKEHKTWTPALPRLHDFRTHLNVQLGFELFGGFLSWVKKSLEDERGI